MSLQIHLFVLTQCKKNKNNIFCYSEDARQHVIHLIRPDEPYEHTTIVTDHKSPIVHLEWSPLHAWKSTSFLLSADRLGHIEIWQPKVESPEDLN